MTEKDKLHTEKKTDKSNQENNILLIGTGMFYWLGLGSFAYLFELILKDIFFNLNMTPSITVIFRELINFLTYIFGVLYLIKIIKFKNIKYLKIFKI